MKSLISFLAPKGERIDFADRYHLELYSKDNNEAHINYLLYVACAENKDFLEDTYQILKDNISKIWGINVFELEQEKMTSMKTNGTFYYAEGKSLEEMSKLTLQCKRISSYSLSYEDDERTNEICRIEMSKDREIIYKIGTLLHEVGHLLLHLRGEEQVEERADSLVIEASHLLLEPFRIGILSSIIKCYTNKYPFEDIELFYIEHFAFNPLRQKYSFNLV